MKILIIAFSLILFCAQAQSGDEFVRLESMRIKGDNEAPQVLFILPWLTPKGAERLYIPIRSSQVERLKPLDPTAFQRELSLHKDWVLSSQKTADANQ